MGNNGGEVKDNGYVNSSGIGNNKGKGENNASSIIRDKGHMGILLMAIEIYRGTILAGLGRICL